MDSERIVAGLYVHKDTVYLCIMRYDEAIIFEKTYGQRFIKYGKLTDYEFGRHIDLEHGNSATRYSEAVEMRKKSRRKKVYTCLTNQRTVYRQKCSKSFPNL